MVSFISAASASTSCSAIGPIADDDGLSAGIDGLFRHVRGAFELDAVAVRIRHRGNPQAVTNKGTLYRDTLGRDLMVDSQRIGAHEADGNALAETTIRRAAQIGRAHV